MDPPSRETSAPSRSGPPEAGPAAGGGDPSPDGRHSRRDAGRGEPAPEVSTQDSSPSTEDARFAINHFATWIGNADTKAGLLAAATTVLAGALVGQRSAVVATLARPTGWQVVALVALALSAVGVVVTTLFLIRAVAPHVRQDGFSRYSWPTVADADLTALLAGQREDDRREAWLSALTLARIVRRKYANLRCAFATWLVGVAGLTVWLVVVP
ncbi:Pycsar system effector family protein [Streptoalloteichus hindustanus]|uniref:Pycsar effector protein domain-containing protein n=1 Tax=Streptoalloteichus hindustanus TaxID=2017 RepID=A0A1M5GVP8_STRHI|nr:Pycsar system effector family protein [Streptoalloteichus hindustanus]SHG07780.1 hypothetical protein SAMN05444320_106288 [Streptoalloteichus hindustanus]